MNKLESMERLAEMVDNKFLALLEKGTNEQLAEDLVSTKLYQAVHEYCSNDLDLFNYYNWGLEDLGEYTRGEFNGYSIKINRLCRPAAYLMSGLYTEDRETKINYYNKALTMLSSMAHELRHAYQQENNMYNDDEYINSSEDYDAYRAQECEVDAREYQRGFFTKQLYEELVNSVK